MTKAPVALTITTGARGGEASGPQPAPARFGERAVARAKLGVAYAALLGIEAVERDILEAMIASKAGGGPTDQPQPRALADGLEAAGLMARVEPVAHPHPDQWPALAQMTSGQFVLVLSQAGSVLTIHDTTCADQRAEVPLAEFEPFFTGLVVRADAPVQSLSRAHDAPEAAPHWFWSQFAGFRRHIAEVALGSFVANILAVAVALFALQVYDRVIPHQSEATLWVLAAGAGLALVMEAALKIARAQLMDGAGRQIELNVQRILMDRILGMRSEIASKSPSQIFSVMREFGSVREFFTASTIGTLTDLPFIVVFLALVASIAGNVVWVLILGGVIMVLPGFLLQRRMMRLTQEMQGASARGARLLHEAIFELDTLKTQRAEDRFRRIWGELTALQAIKSSEQRRLGSVLSFWAQAVQQATYIVAVILGSYLVFAGEFTVGSIIAVGILTSRTLGPLTQLSSTLARWGNVKSALVGLDAIALADQDEGEGRSYLRRTALTGAYELREVQFAYDAGGAPVLDIPGLIIQPGQVVAVLGTNGSGKSTFLKLLSGLYAPSRGRLMLDGTDMGQIAPRDLRRMIGYLGQDVRLFTGSLRENLNLTLLERDDARLMQALDFAGLGPFVRGHPKGLDLEILDGGQGLSQGQRQSIGWARLWLQDPAVCLLDEPTAALDQTLERTLVSRLETWLKGRTAVIATHRMPILSLTSRTLILQAGRMAVDGPRDQVLAHLAQAAGTGPGGA
ncbi:ATP-binding cassette domain-containing protein [Roseovarius mucosus]|uniref:ATP-binding cassette domain-containing protein n=1 Tax=Roseovarius mucosus TaxID=215743 RepID=UPI003BAA199E